MASRDKIPPTRPDMDGGSAPTPPKSHPLPLLVKEGKEGKSILLPYQRRWINDDAPLKIWLASRQVGKSFTLAMEAVREALKGKSNNLILSASERQSREVMHKVYSHLRYLNARSEEAIGADGETKEEVSLPNGSRIISLPASPDTVRGFSGNVFLDEFAFHKDSNEIWQAMYPTVTRGYKLRISSTPNGKQNMFYRLWEGAGDGWSRHRTDVYDAVNEGVKVDIEALRTGIADPVAWAQEFECRFVDEATAFITYEMIASCEEEGATKEIVGANPCVRPPDTPEGQTRGSAPTLYLGVDIGRKHDLTVFWLLEKVGDVLWTRMVREMRGETFRVQRDFLYALMSEEWGWNPHIKKEDGRVGIHRCCIDSTGIGAQFAEEAAEKFPTRIEPVTFTPAVKEDLAITLRRKFEDRLLRIPADRDIREDIHSVRRFTTTAGNIRFDSERTEMGHADRFWALALALHAAGVGAKHMPVQYEAVTKRSLADFVPARWPLQRAGCW